MQFNYNARSISEENCIYINGIRYHNTCYWITTVETVQHEGQEQCEMTPYTATGSATAGIGHLLAENTDLSSLVYIFNAILAVNMYNNAGTFNPPHAAFLGYKWVKENATHANGSIVNQYVLWQLLALEQEHMRCFTVKLFEGVKESDCFLPMRGICNCTGDRARIEILKQGEIFYVLPS